MRLVGDRDDSESGLHQALDRGHPPVVEPLHPDADRPGVPVAQALAHADPGHLRGHVGPLGRVLEAEVDGGAVLQVAAGGVEGPEAGVVAVAADVHVGEVAVGDAVEQAVQGVLVREGLELGGRGGRPRLLRLPLLSWNLWRGAGAGRIIVCYLVDVPGSRYLCLTERVDVLRGAVRLVDLLPPELRPGEALRLAEHERLPRLHRRARQVASGDDGGGGGGDGGQGGGQEEVGPGGQPQTSEEGHGCE